MQQLVDILVEDTFLPISHDLPCMSRILLQKMVGLDVNNDYKLNVRNPEGITLLNTDVDLSCIDVAISRAMALKMVRLFEETNLDEHFSEDWRARALSAEEKCVLQSN